MRLEVFSAAKDPAAPASNDDRVVVAGDRLFAVIDGVTDKSGSLLPNGFSRGQFAGVVIERELVKLAGAGPAADIGASELVAAVTAGLSSEYRRLGFYEAAASDLHVRCAAQLAALLRAPGGWRLIVVGDCGARLDGVRVVGGESPGDSLMALWRAQVFGALRAAGAGVMDALRVSREYALAGSGAHLAKGAPWLAPERHAELAESALAQAVERFPELTREQAAAALRGGILGMAAHRNRPGPLGAACLDGFEVPLSLVIDEFLPDGSFRVVELFSDGYFGTPPVGAVGVDAWEAHIAEVESSDPHKIGAHASTKGSSPGKFTDDRSVIVVYPDGAEAPREHERG